MQTSFQQAHHHTPTGFTFQHHNRTSLEEIDVQEIIDETPNKDILVVQGDWNAKIGEDAQEDWKGTSGPYCNTETNDRDLRLLEFATLNNLKVTNTFHPHKTYRRWTWLSPNGSHHHIDYILVKRRF
jgi:hypothetical protein